MLIPHRLPAGLPSLPATAKEAGPSDTALQDAATLSVTHYCSAPRERPLFSARRAKTYESVQYSGRDYNTLWPRLLGIAGVFAQRGAVSASATPFRPLLRSPSGSPGCLLFRRSTFCASTSHANSVCLLLILLFWDSLLPERRSVCSQPNIWTSLTVGLAVDPLH